jgi:dolichyl-phosphate-mannose--protein O-mannosyl transferase
VYAGGFAATAVRRWVDFVVVGTVLVWVGKLQERIKVETGREGELPPFVLTWFAGGLGFLFLNFEVNTFFYDYWPRAQLAALSILWTACSIGMMVCGFMYRRAALRKCALVLFAATIFKVFLYDMAEAATPFRIASFMVLGLVLIGASYLYHRYKDLILPPLRDTE